jgi:hypothetical protein
LRDAQAAFDLLGAQGAKLVTLFRNELTALCGAQFLVVQFLPLLGHQVAQLLPVLQTGLRVILQLAGLLRAGTGIALVTLFGDEIAELLALLRAQLRPLGRLEILPAQFLMLFGLQFADLLARLIARECRS